MPEIQPYITYNKILEYIKDYGLDVNKVSDTLYSIFTEADKEDINGNNIEERGFSDGILNKNESKKFIEILKDKSGELYNVFTNYMNKITSKSDNEILAENMEIITSPLELIPDKEIFLTTFNNLNIDNLTEVIKNYKDKSIQPFFFTIINNLDIALGNINDEVFFDKMQSLADDLVIKAKENNIYTKDYERDFKNAKINKDYKNYAIALDRLTERYIIETDNNSLNASKRKQEKKEPNGNIDENFAQGYTGNCWFIAAISSICENKEALKKLNNMISIENIDGKIQYVNVNIQGTKYKIDYEELVNANEYSSGDLDVRALEIAVNRYMHTHNIGDDISHPNLPETAYECLFGKDNIQIDRYKDNENIFNTARYFNDMSEKNNTKISNLHSLNDYLDKPRYATNNKGENVKIKKMHVYTFIRIDSQYIYFKDTVYTHGDTNDELSIPISEFSEIFEGATTVKLGK